MANLVDAIQKRCNELRETYLPEYDKIPEGKFAALMIRQSIKYAEAAISSGDVVLCVEAMRDLEGYSL